MIWTNMMHERTYDLTNLEIKVNANRYMRWHITFSRSVTSVLSKNVVSVPAENSFQPNPSMNMQNKNLKLCTPHTQTPHLCIWRATTHIIALMTASPLRTETTNMWYYLQAHWICVHDTAPQNTSLDRHCIRSYSHSSHLPWHRGKMIHTLPLKWMALILLHAVWAT